MDLWKESFPMAKNLHSGKMRKIVTNWNEICGSKSIDHDGSIDSCFFSTDKNVISAEVGKSNPVTI